MGKHLKDLIDALQNNAAPQYKKYTLALTDNTGNGHFDRTFIGDDTYLIGYRFNRITDINITFDIDRHTITATSDTPTTITATVALANYF